MTRKNCLTNLKKKLILVLAFVCILCAMAFCLTACDDSETVSVTDPTYSKTETTTTISNANFYTGSANLDLTKFPITSATGWTTATDNSSNTSSVNSGVVRTSESAWSALLSNLYDDSDFLNYVKNIYGVTDSDIKTAIQTEKGKASDYTPTDDEKKEYITNTYLISDTNKKFANPGVHEDAEDDAIFMLNNIAVSSKFKLGTAQKVTSSSTVSLEKGCTYKISVWVKTANIENRGTNNGANIRLKNTFNSSTQAYYQISGIIADEWTQYSIYVKADSDYTCAVTLILGLGYGNGSTSLVKDWVEGTAFFDDITCEKVDDASTSLLTASKMVYGSEDNIEATLESNVCFYDMSFANSVDTFFDNSVALPTDGYLTTSNTTLGGDTITSKTNNPASEGSVTVADNIAKISVNQASYTTSITDSSFTLNYGEFALVTFYYKNLLNKLGSTDVTIDAIDKYGDITAKRSALSSFSVVGDAWTKCTYLFKNTWEGQVREFSINVVVGPTNVRTVEYASDFATGDVYIKNIKLAKGIIDNEDEDYCDIYKFFESNANSTVNLYAGYSAEYSEDDTTTSYNIETAYGNFGDIINKVTAPSDYEGVEANHAFINPSSNNYYTNTRINEGTTDGVAGVINSNYINNYTDGTEIATKLNAGEDTIQALMINNKTSNSYGFIGKNVTVSASAYASVSVNIRVCDDAIAYIYLVDISKAEKKVLTFGDFTTNDDVISSIPVGTEIDGSTLSYSLRITKDNMDEDGWATVNFYVGAGANAKSFRVEIWNGSRYNTEKSTGYIFVDDVTVTTSSAFSEPTSWAQAFATEGNPLYTAKSTAFSGNYSLLTYTRELTELEKTFNSEYPDEAVSYSPNYVWGKTATMVYGVYNTIDPVENDPYADKTDEDEDSGCANAETNPSSFWLGFSSILLGVVLILAMVALIVKKIVAKKKANASDAKSHFTVTSRIRKANIKKAQKTENVEEEKEETSTIDAEEKVEEINEVETPTEEQPQAEEQKDDYVYGDVQTFGEETKEEVKEEVKEESTEEKTEENPEQK